MHTWRVRLVPVLFVSALISFVACQSYDFVFQPLTDLQGSHLQFTVQTPSKADILFMVDNSGSMTLKQKQLLSSFSSLLSTLAPQDTKYRIGIVSSDAYGVLTDRSGVANPVVPSNFYSSMGAIGSYYLPNQNIPGCAGNSNALAAGDPNAVANPNGCWQLRRPHDGALGRLIAGFDPNSFNPNNYITCDPNASNPNASNPNNPNNPNGTTVNPNNCAIFNAIKALMPTGAFSGPSSLYDSQGPGARWVINRDAIDHETCDACGCLSATCTKGNVCYESCAKPSADIMVEAYFSANIYALGNEGFGWEQGLKSSLWAVGIDPENANDTVAIDPAYNLVAGTGNPNVDPPNVYGGTDSPEAATYGSWLREDALLALMYVSDEQDCSMPQSYIQYRSDFEQYANPNQPVESMCYQRSVQQAVAADGRYDPNRLSRLLLDLKGGPTKTSQVAVGIIAALQLNGPTLNPASEGVGADCVVQAVETPSTACTCLDTNLTTGNQPDPGWCLYTLDNSGYQAYTNGSCTPGGCSAGSCPSTCLPGCQGRSGSVYVSFADNFPRRSFESICRNDTSAYGPALQDFARLATQACFNLKDIQPYNGDPNYITVTRTASGQNNPVALTQQPSISTADGWYFDSINNAVCLTGLERLIGDTYDIYIQQQYVVSYTQ